MIKFRKYIRLRKASQNPKTFLRLHRAEFGHDFKKAKVDLDNYYPDIENLKTKIANYHKLNSENINLGLGAESLIKDIIIWHQQKFLHKKVLNTHPNYFMYEIFLKLFNYKKTYFKIDPMCPEKLDASKIIKLVKLKNINLLILVNPAHPFEKYWSKGEILKILRFCKKKRVTILIDEVYQGLDTQSAGKLVKKNSNLIILRSMSKTFGLPGLRIGYTIANKKTSSEIESFRLSHELPTSSIIKGLYLFKTYKKNILSRLRKIKKAKKFAHNEFKKRKLISIGKYGNSVNVYFKNRVLVKKVGNYLKKNKIIVNFNYDEPFSNYLNITTTNIHNLKIFFKFFDKIYKP